MNTRLRARIRAIKRHFRLINKDDYLQGIATFGCFERMNSARNKDLTRELLRSWRPNFRLPVIWKKDTLKIRGDNVNSLVPLISDVATAIYHDVNGIARDIDVLFEDI